MGELWNLDQALVWIASRDGQKVLWARGDAWGDQIRQFGYADFQAEATEDDRMVGGVFPDGDEEDECDVTAVLMWHLQAGKVKAYRADNGSQIETFTLNSCTCVPSELCVKRDKNGIVMTLLEAPSSPSPEDAAGQKSLPALFCVSDLKALFPPKAPAELQDQLANFVENAPSVPSRLAETLLPPPSPKPKPLSTVRRSRGRPKSAGRVAAEEDIARNYPNGLPPVADGSHQHAEAVNDVINRIWSEREIEADRSDVTRANNTIAARRRA